MSTPVLTPNNLGSSLDTTTEPGKFNLAADNGLNVGAGGVRLGGTLDSTTTIDGDFTLIRNSGTATSVQNYTTGAGAHGTYNITGGPNAHGIYSVVLGAGSYAGYFVGDVFYTGALVPSDRRLKENITPITTAIDGILKLEVVEFDKFSESDFDIPQARETGDEKQDAAVAERVAQNIAQIEKAIGRSFTEEELKAGKAHIRKAAGHRTGVIAQQLQEVFPQFVTDGPNGFLAIEESGVNWMLLKAVQELAARVVALEAK